MTAEDLWNECGNELIGLLVDAFAQAERSQVNPADKGRYVMQKMRQAREFLRKVHAAMQPENKPAKPTSIKDTVRN